MASEEEKPIQEVLSLPILLADRVIKSAQEAESFKSENSNLTHHVTQLSQLLCSTARLISASPATLYDRPIRRVSADLTKSLDRALTFVRKRRHRKTNVLHHVLCITTAADFKKLATLLDSSLADIKSVISIFNRNSSLTKSLDRTLTLAHKCRHCKTNVLHHVLSITTAADFKKLAALLDSSLADIKWVVSIFNRNSFDYETANLSRI